MCLFYAFLLFVGMLFCPPLSLSLSFNNFVWNSTLIFLMLIFKENEFSNIFGVVMVVLNTFSSLVILILPFLLFSWHLSGFCLSLISVAPGCPNWILSQQFLFIVGLYPGGELWWNPLTLKPLFQMAVGPPWRVFWVLLFFRAARCPADVPLLPPVLRMIVHESCNRGCSGSSYFGF